MKSDNKPTEKLFRLLADREEILTRHLSIEQEIVAAVNEIERSLPKYFADNEDFLRTSRAKARLNITSVSFEISSNKQI